jgi:hypothetical protein
MTATLTASANISGTQVFKWYDSQTSTNVLFTGAKYTTPALTATKTYYVSVSSENYCENVTNDRKAVTVTVNPFATAANITAPGATICSGITATLTASANITGTQVFKWYDSQTSTNVLFTGAKYTTPALTATKTYYVSVSSENYCENATNDRKAVTATVTPVATSADITATAPTICSGMTTTLTASTNISGTPTFRWYDSLTSTTVLATGADYTTPKLTATATYYVSVSSANYCENAPDDRKAVTVTVVQDCGTTNPTGCAVSGTLIWEEDFDRYGDGLNPASEMYSLEPLPAGMTTYNFTSEMDDKKGMFAAGTYALVKKGNSGWVATYFLDDHTYPNNTDVGRCFITNGKSTPDQVYTQTIDGLCSGTELYFSFWMNGINGQVVWTIYSSTTNNVLATFGPLSASNQGTWKQYGFPFILPPGETSIRFEIFNNDTRSGGNDIGYDDIAVYLCAPEVMITQPVTTDTAVCPGTSVTFSGNYIDDGIFGKDLIYRWLYSATGDINNPAEWTTISEGNSADGKVSAIYTVPNAIKTNGEGYYRLVVSNSKNINNNNCRAMSDVIYLQVYDDFKPGAISGTQTICHNTVPAKIAGDSPTGGNVPYSYQWQSDDGNGWQDIPGATSADYNPPALTKTTKYRRIATSAGGCGSLESNEATITVLSSLLSDYPDIRAEVCPENDTVTLGKYIDTTILKSLVWEKVSGAQISADGIVEANELPASNIHVYKYTVSNSCVSDIERRFYLHLINSENLHLPRKDTIVVSGDHADAIHLNQVLGIEVQGDWDYDVKIKPYIREITSAPHSGAVIFDGDGAYNDSNIPFTTYHDLTRAKEFVFTFNATDDCLADTEYEIVIILALK